VIVHPEHQNRGIGKELMKSVERRFSGCGKFSLFTGSLSKRNLYFYGSLGYEPVRKEKVNDKLTLVYLEKNNKGQ
jgi:GNAT superfamily N-acetyltransferase